MAYTNNVPQGNQTIAQTTDPIRNNFAFIETDLQVEHQFNGNVVGLAEGVHLKASMPNRALSPALPANTNGIYFVSSGLAYFYDGTNNYRLNPFQEVLTGSYTATSSSIFNTIVAVPANVQGIIIMTYDGKPAGQMGLFHTDGSNCYAFSTRMKLNGSADDYPIELNNSCASLNIQGRYFSSSYAGPYNFKVFYRPA